MRIHRKLTAALGAAAAVLFLTASPVSATVGTGVITGGSIVVDPNFGLPDIIFDLTGETPHECSDPNDPAPTIDVDFVGNTSNGTTEVVDVDFGSAYADFAGNTYDLDIDLTDPTAMPTPSQDGIYALASAGPPRIYDVDQDLDLTIDVYDTDECERGEVVCEIRATFLLLTGTFEGTIDPASTPPANGDLLLNGGGTLDTNDGDCDFAIRLAFEGASAAVSNLTAEFPA